MSATPRLLTSVPARGPRRTRERILADIRAAAVHEFSRNGYAGTSTQAIATRANLTKPQLHYYIACKDALYVELLGSLVTAWRGMFDTHSNDPRRVLTAYIRAKLRLAFDHPEISRLFTREVLDGGRHLHAFWPEARERTAEKVAAIRRWIDLGLLQPMEPHALLMAIWAITQFYADSALQVQELHAPADARWTPERNRLIDELTAFVLRGCGVQA